MQTFLFGPYPQKFETIDVIFLVDIVGALLLGIVLWLVLPFAKVNPVTAGLINRFKNLGLVYGFLGLLWLAFRFEGARYLEWRFWIVLIALAATVWLIKIIAYWTRGYPKDKAAHENKKLKAKYLK